MGLNMSIFYPSMMFQKISDISPEHLASLGVSALILDVDNTLTTHNNPEPDIDVLAWLETMSKSGIKLIIASNNSKKRVKLFAERLGMDFVFRASKPLPFGFLRVARRMKMPAESFGIVGDQIFTDILGGNLFGAKTFLVKPMGLEKGPLFRLKRKIETPVLKAYSKSILKKEKESGKS